MPRTICKTCHNATLDWSWTEAFDKFGFGDGDGQVMTEDVAEILRFAGYTVVVEPWGLHNVTIASIKLGGVEQIPFDRITFGYDDPRSYLPADIIRLLDKALPDQGEVVA
ncbi:MAG: hypothetical protein AB7O57_16955 [Hyphomicrobiaceae bacterium]